MVRKRCSECSECFHRGEVLLISIILPFWLAPNAIFATERRCTSRKKSSLRILGSKKVGGRENIEFIRRNGVMFLCMSFITELRFRNG